MEEQVKLEENKPKRDELGRLLPGNTANPHGRPKGKTLKEYQAEVFRNMSDEDKAEWLKDVPKDTRWRMSEGNPIQDSKVEVEGSLPINLIIKRDDSGLESANVPSGTQ